MKNVYGVEMTELESMKFDRFRNSSSDIPAFNTITKEERTKIARRWLTAYRFLTTK